MFCVMMPCRNFGASGPETAIRRRDESATRPEGGDSAAREALLLLHEKFRRAAVLQLAQMKRFDGGNEDDEDGLCRQIFLGKILALGHMIDCIQTARSFFFAFLFSFLFGRSCVVVIVVIEDP